MAFTERPRKIHFIGIGGIGMSGLAEILLKLGHSVSGSDIKSGEIVKRLESLGAKIQIGHSEKIFSTITPDVVVYSTAVSKNNPELLYANRAHIPIIRRAEMLGELMRLKRGIAVAGSHGKTTTTAMLGLILKNAGLDPSLVIGGSFDAIGSNATWGGGDWLLAEADESDGSFLKLMPEYCIVTNIDMEHLDHYGEYSSVCNAFAEFLDHVPFYGKAVLCSDSLDLRKLSTKFNKPRLWYGFLKEQNPDYLIRIVSEDVFPEIEILTRKSNFKEVFLKLKLAIPGKHNLLNASGAAILAKELGVSSEIIGNTLLEFRGVRRRFELKGELKGVKIYEDYAHHPTEIYSTLEAARSVFKENKIAVIFQPHRYSRTKQCWDTFKTCFKNADYLFTTNIYPASETREGWVDGIDAENFYNHVKVNDGSYFTNFDEAKAKINQLISSGKIKKGDAVFVLGAGDVNQIASNLVNDK